MRSVLLELSNALGDAHISLARQEFLIHWEIRLKAFLTKVDFRLRFPSMLSRIISILFHVMGFSSVV